MSNRLPRAVVHAGCASAVNTTTPAAHSRGTAKTVVTAAITISNQKVAIDSQSNQEAVIPVNFNPIPKDRANHEYE